MKFSMKRVARRDSGGDKDNELARFGSHLIEHIFPLVRLKVLLVLPLVPMTLAWAL